MAQYGLSCQITMQLSRDAARRHLCSGMRDCSGMSTPHFTILPGNPDFLDLPWQTPLASWEVANIVELPRGVHRHVVRFVAYGSAVYAIKELPVRFARIEFAALRELQARNASVVEVAGIVERSWVDPTEEWSAAVITRFLDFAFSYRELISGSGFGKRRDQLLDGFAGLLVELHLLGCYWGDCSLSNVLYRYDAAALDITMVDAETSELHDALSDGQRRADIEVMILNVAGGMADIAAERGHDLDDADVHLGEDIERRYVRLWDELTRVVLIGPDEGFRIAEHVARVNELGFQVDEVDLIPVEEGRRLRLKVEVGGRLYHQGRLAKLTGIRAGKRQARQILSDLRYHVAKSEEPPVNKSVAAMQWRVEVFEPLLKRITDALDGEGDAIQKYCDFLHHRYILASNQGQDVSNDVAYADWVAGGMPGPPAA